jgi:predicted ATPase
LASITDNVVELMALKIQKLPSSTQRVLKLAACIGNQFELETLALVDEQSLRETATSLHAAVAEGLILPLGDAYKSIELDVPQSSNNLTVEYKFVHDRIQQAAYSLIPDESRQLMHRQVGQLLLQNTPLDEREEKIFDIVNQLNLGLAFINHQSERNELAQLNLIASKKAKAATAYEPSFKYLLVGLALLEVQHWQTQYELALALYIEAAEVAYLYGNFEEMERLAEVVLQQAKTVLDKVKVYEVRIQAYIAQDKPKEAVSTALTVLKLLEINLPKEPRRFQIAIALWQTKLALVGKPIEDLINLPPMTDPIKLAAMRILCSVISAASFSSPKLFPLIALKALNLSLKYGNTSLSTYAYATYGQILSGVVGNIDAGYQFGQLALALLSQLNARELKAKVLLVVNDFIIHWREHVRETLDPFVEAYKGGLETGDLEFTARSAMVYSYHSYFIGKELTNLEQEIKNYSDIIKQLKQTKFIYMNERYRQVVLNLMGKTENPCRLVGEAYDEEILLPLHIQSNDRNAIFNVYLHKAILCYTFQDYLEAFENTRKAEKYLDNATGLLLVPIYYFYNSLIKLSVLTHSFAFKPKVLLKKVLANQRKLKKWVKLCANESPA